MIKSFKKIFAIMLSVFMLSLFTISAFALENVSTMSDGHFPDYASYWYNSSDDKTTLLISPNHNSSASILRKRYYRTLYFIHSASWKLQNYLI